MTSPPGVMIALDANTLALSSAGDIEYLAWPNYPFMGSSSDVPAEGGISTGVDHGTPAPVGIAQVYCMTLSFTWDGTSVDKESRRVTCTMSTSVA